MFYVPGSVRNVDVIADIFMRRGSLSAIVPVELASFKADVSGNNVTLNWITASEINNSGFEIERCETSNVKGQTWKRIGFVGGKGTSTELNTYQFTDNNLSSGKYQYRLKQIDFDGTINYSNIVEVSVDIPSGFSLEQNYPNPFNPTTKIKYTIPSVITSATKQSQLVSLKVYDLLGNEVATLVNEEKPAGTYEVEFNAGNLSSGMYIYQMKVNDFESVKKMLIMK